MFFRTKQFVGNQRLQGVIKQAKQHSSREVSRHPSELLYWKPADEMGAATLQTPFETFW